MSTCNVEELGIVLFEIPSNMILYRVGPDKWLTLQLFVFGIVSTFQAFQTDYASFISTRLLLGITEHGSIPGGLVDMLPEPRSTFLPNVEVFTAHEVHILNSRVKMHDPMKDRKEKHIGLAGFKKAFSTWRMSIHVVITLCNNGPQRAFDTYAPSLLRDFGFGSLSANALASVGLFLQIPISYAFSYLSDHYNRRGETDVTGFTCHLIGYVLNRIFTEVPNQGLRYLGVIWTQIFGTLSHPLNIS